MEDREILALYFSRNEQAIAETDRKYGALCRSIARGILTFQEDAEECVSDAYLNAWNAIPPQHPEKLGVWLGRVVRNLAYNLWNHAHRKKRDTGMTELLGELADCIPSSADPARQLEERELTEFLNGWLRALPREDRVLFLRRYWNGEPLHELSKRAGTSPNALAKRMYRLRKCLKAALEKEGYSL